MFLTLADNIHFIIIALIVIVIIVFSIIFVNSLKRDFKKLYKLRARFHIEIRKIVNLIYNIHKSKKLEPFTKQVIKTLSHDEKVEIIKVVDDVFMELDHDDKDNKYIVETYDNMYKLMRERDDLLEDYNRTINSFPQNIYARIMKLPKYEYYTDRD